MTGFQINRQSLGIALVEALIALTVLSVGMLSIARFQGELTAGSGLSKARSEAVQLAQDKIEEFRNLSTEAQYNALATGSDTAPIVGTNTSFQRNWIVTAVNNPPARQVQVSVVWDDPKEGEQRVDLFTMVVWDDPSYSGTLATGVLAGTGGFLRPPTGEGSLESDKVYETIPLDAVLNPDGTYTYVTDDGDGRRELIAADGKVLMVLKDNSEFSTIEGRIYTTEGDTWLAEGDMYIVTSDAVYCGRYGGINSLPETGAAKYHYVDYRCYVGPQWYGNVGVVRTGGNAPNERVCLGDPAVAYSDVFGSRHPAMSTTRSYRGYEYEGIHLKSVGIGMSTGTYVAAAFDDHDFLLTNLSGQVVDTKCADPQNLITSSVFTGNPGTFVCLTDTCPVTQPTGEPPITIVSGTITYTDTNVGSLNSLVTGLVIDSGECPVYTVGPAGKSIAYECEIDWRGWTGDTWSGNMILQFASPGEICSFAITNVDPICEGNNCVSKTGDAIVFSAIPPGLDVIGINIIVEAEGTCPVL